MNQRSREPILRCAAQSRIRELDPAGTAGSWAGVLLAPLPLPWPGSIENSNGLASEHAEASERGWRLQAVAPPGPHGARPIRFSQPPGPFRRFDSDLAVTMVLICTHGARDTCCGSAGTRLWRAVDDQLSSAAVYRTSHLGGHRFAPTAVLLPEGTSWAYLDPDLLQGIVDRTVDPSLAARHYRGCVGLGHPALQVAEREVFAMKGWRVFDSWRDGEVVARGDDCFTVELRVLDTVFEVGVEVARRLPMPSCGEDPGATTAQQIEWTATGVSEIFRH